MSDQIQDQSQSPERQNNSEPSNTGDGEAASSTSPTAAQYATPEQYLMVLGVLKMLASYRDLPVAACINSLNRAETLGPISDPTLYIKSREQAEKTRRQLQALLELQNLLKP